MSDINPEKLALFREGVIVELVGWLAVWLPIETKSERTYSTQHEASPSDQVCLSRVFNTGVHAATFKVCFYIGYYLIELKVSSEIVWSHY